MKSVELAAIVERHKYACPADGSIKFISEIIGKDVPALLAYIHDLECRVEILKDQADAKNDLRAELAKSDLQNEAIRDLLVEVNIAYTLKFGGNWKPLEDTFRKIRLYLEQTEKPKCEGLQLGESRDLPYPKPISDTDAKNWKNEGGNPWAPNMDIPAETRICQFQFSLGQFCLLKKGHTGPCR